MSAPTDGSGPGVTWECRVDTQISNDDRDCDGSDRWDGGDLAAPTAPGGLHTEGMTGEVAWDVTQDVLDGAKFGWALFREHESRDGEVLYVTREGAVVQGDLTKAPRLILKFEGN